MAQPITNSPSHVETGTLGEPGVAWGVAPDGTYGGGLDVQQVPNTRTPPYGEAPLWTADQGLVAEPITPPFDAQKEKDAQHEWIHGTPWKGYDLGEWVNPDNPGIPNLLSIS